MNELKSTTEVKLEPVMHTAAETYDSSDDAAVFRGPPYVTPAVKCMMRRKNKLMRLGRCEEAAAFAKKIGVVIKNFNSAELSRVVMCCPILVMCGLK